MGFTMSQSDTSLCVKYDGVDVIALLLYVNDIILTGSNPKKVQPVITKLGDVFDLKDMGKLSYFLGLQITYKLNGDIFLSQTKYAKDLLHKAGMDNCKSVNTPCKPHSQFLDSEGIPLPDPTFYRSVVGALQYLTFTRPDLAYAVNVACQYMNTPTEVHMIWSKGSYVMCKSKKQASVSRSSTEAEYKSLAHCAADITWIRNILRDLH
ncbi:hypothetical protein FF1_040699 [Malus domestica]